MMPRPRKAESCGTCRGQGGPQVPCPECDTVRRAEAPAQVCPICWMTICEHKEKS